jgi:N-acetylmuramic acid 6-phosphate (MurNAc-6-P) etherase
VLAAAGGRVKTAVVMVRRGVDRATAEALLAAGGGRLAAVIDGA